MLRAGLNIVLLLAAITLVVGNWALLPDPRQPNYDFLPDMARGPRYNAFSGNPNFADGKTLQSPPPGTIPRGLTPLHYAATPQDALRAGEELHSPLPDDSAQARERGAAVFANYCVVCHGAKAIGDGAVTQRGFPPPPSLLLPHATNMKDGQLFHVLTYGQGNMPSYAGQLSRQDRWSVIAYLRTMQGQAPAASPGPEVWPRVRRAKRAASIERKPATPDSPHEKALPGSFKPSPAPAVTPASAVQPEAARQGAEIFADHCAMCHGADASGGGEGGPPTLVGEHACSLSDEELFSTISNGRGPMPRWAGQLSEQERRSVIAYLRVLQGHGGPEPQLAAHEQHEAREHRQPAQESILPRRGRP